MIVEQTFYAYNSTAYVCPFLEIMEKIVQIIIDSLRNQVHVVGGVVEGKIELVSS